MSDFKIDRSLHFDKDGELKTPDALIYKPPGGTYPAMQFPDGTEAYPAGNTSSRGVSRFVWAAVGA